METLRPETESPRQFHFHEFRGPVDRSANLGQRGGKRPGAGRPRLYRDGEKPRYKYRYRYINVSEEVFTKFQRLKFDAGCKAEKNFMILLLDLFERHNGTFGPCVDVGCPSNLERWKKLCSQLSLTSEQIATFVLDLAEQHLFRGRCPENAAFPTLDLTNSQTQSTTDNSPLQNPSESVVVKTEPSDPTDSGIASDAATVPANVHLTFGELLNRSMEVASAQPPSAVLPPMQVSPTPTMPPSINAGIGQNLLQNATPSKPPTDDLFSGISMEHTSAHGSNNKTPQPYVTFKWWNVFPSERSKRKSRCQQISNLLASEKAEHKSQQSRSNTMRETSGYIPKSISQILPKSTPQLTYSQAGSLAKPVHVEPVKQLEKMNHPPPEYPAGLIVSQPELQCVPTPVETVNAVPLMWSLLPPGVATSVLTPVCAPTATVTTPVIQDDNLPLNLSMKAVATRQPQNTPSPTLVPSFINIPTPPDARNDSPVTQNATENVTDAALEPKLKRPVHSDPNVRRKVQNLMSTISKIGNQTMNAQNKGSSVTVSDTIEEIVADPESLPLDSTTSKSSRKMSVPTKKVCDVPEIKQEAKESLVDAINLELSKTNAEQIASSSQQKRSYSTRSALPTPEVESQRANRDPDGKYYIMSLCKKKKVDDPEFGRWSFAKTRSWQKNGKRQWKINRIENYICKSCGKTFMSEKWFIKHVEAEHCGKGKESKCFSGEPQVASVATTDFTQPQMEYTCNVCAKTFSRETDLFLHKSSGPCHKKDDYMTEGFHRCTYADCCRIFSSEYNLFQHTRRCHDLGENVPGTQ